MYDQNPRVHCWFMYVTFAEWDNSCLMLNYCHHFWYYSEMQRLWKQLIFFIWITTLSIITLNVDNKPWSSILCSLILMMEVFSLLVSSNHKQSLSLDLERDVHWHPTIYCVWCCIDVNNINVIHNSKCHNWIGNNEFGCPFPSINIIYLPTNL